MCADWPRALCARTAPPRLQSSNHRFLCFVVLELDLLSVVASFESRRLYQHKLFLLTKTHIDHDAAEHGWDHTKNSCSSKAVSSSPPRLELYAHNQLLRILL
ncbi:hypothetical protein BKA62DRAFT_724082 [Auriculariales sp. MPI-PUGE-AT-0066]|nr:hypothetical protein BKA62DRAFT_724082 [Auriculariales sp. MPI-PUGE-AT-0066]